MKQETEKIIEIVNSISEKELKDGIIKILLQNNSFYDIFRLEFLSFFPNCAEEIYERKISQAIDECGGEDGYIDYKESRKYEEAMAEFMKDANEYVKGKNYELAFIIIKIILNSIPNMNIDDSNGSTGGVAYECIETLEEILGYVLVDKKEIVNDILDFILNEVETGVLNNYAIILVNLLIYYIDEEYELERIKKSLEIALKEKNIWSKEDYEEMLEKCKQKLV